MAREDITDPRIRRALGLDSNLDGNLTIEAVMGPNRANRERIPGLSIPGIPRQPWEDRLAPKVPERFRFCP